MLVIAICPQGDIEIRVTILDVNDNPPTVDNTLNITIEEVTYIQYFMCTCVHIKWVKVQVGLWVLIQFCETCVPMMNYVCVCSHIGVYISVD